MKNKKGFTLIELLAVIVVLSIIMVIAVISVNKVIENSRKNAFTSNAKIIEGSVKRSNITQDEEKFYVNGKIYNNNGEPIGKLEIDDENLEYYVVMEQGEVYFHYLMSDKLMIDVRKCASKEYCLAKEVSSKVVVKKFEVDKEISAIYPKVKDEKPGDITNGEKAGSVLAGTKELPYEIRSIEDLVALSSTVNDTSNNYRDKYIKLAYNLDFNNNDSYMDSNKVSINDINGNGVKTSLKDELTNYKGSGFIPIGTYLTSFSGIFDGNAKYINNLYINKPSLDSIGLFGYVSYGTIKGINLVNVNINGRDSVGGIIGSNSHGVLSTATVTGNVTGNNALGLSAGLAVGYGDEANITNIITSGNVNAKKTTLAFVGGIAGLLAQSGTYDNTGIFLSGSLSEYYNGGGNKLSSRYMNNGNIIKGFVNEDIMVNNSYLKDESVDVSALKLRTEAPYKEVGFNFTDTTQEYIWYMENGKAKFKKN